MRHSLLLSSFFAAAFFLVSSLALADEPTASSPPAFGMPASTETLRDLRGGAETTNSQMNLQGNTSGNTADRVVTGSNSIGQGSFAGMSGIPLVVQNTGANVLIQNAVIVNVKMN